MSQYYFRHLSNIGWENSEEGDELVSDEPINNRASINDETDLINETSEEDSETLWKTNSVKKADQLCYRLNNFDRGLIAKSLYKYFI